MKQLLIIPSLMLLISCGNQNKAKMSEKTESLTEQKITSSHPEVSKFTDSPLRNSIELELNAPVNEVWALVGKLERMPEYSSGLKELKVNYDDSNNCTDYTCYFFPFEEGGEVTTHSETIIWYEPMVGYASVAHEPNLGGMQNTLGMITLEPKDNKTILHWDVYFDAVNNEALQMNIIGFEQALNNDIAQNLVKTFGGKVIESFVQKL